MKNLLIGWILALSFAACNNTGKDSVEKADSINQAKLDTGLQHKDIVVDEASSAFLVRVANNGMAELQLAAYAREKATLPGVKSFAAILYNDHSGVHATLQTLAARKNIVLPATVSDEKQKEIDQLKTKTGKDLDKTFISTMISAHKTSIESFETAMTETKDPDIRSFADKTLPALRAHLDSAERIQKRYW